MTFRTSAALTFSLIFFGIGGCVGRVAVQILDGETGRPMPGVAVYHGFGPGDPFRQVLVGVPVGHTDEDGRFVSATNDGLINTFSFQQKGYRPATVQAEYNYRQVGVYLADERPGEHTFARALRSEMVTVRLRRVEPTISSGEASVQR